MFFKTVPFMNNHDVDTRYRPRFFDQVGHQIMYAFIGNKCFFTISCHCQTYRKYEQSQQKLGTFLESKVCEKLLISNSYMV